MSSTDKQTALVNQLQIDVPKEKVKAHLQVLGVFFHLLDTLAGTSKPEDVEATVDEIFQRSTYRLQVWLEQVVNTDGEEDFEKKPLQDHELPPLDVALALHSVIECQSCGAAASVPWAGARGFASPGFEYDCAQCGLVVNHDLLCAGKFFKALARAKNDPGFCLPNTARRDDKGEIPSLKDLATSAANEGSGTMAYIANKLSRADALRAESLLILLRAFEHSYPFTQDVVVALHHQRPFINVYKQGWSAPQTAVPSDGDLDDAYALYADFLDRVIHIQRREPGWQDDPIWHTHQLMPQTYRAFIVGYLHVYSDHLPKAKTRTRPHYDNKRNPKSVSVWVQSSDTPALATKHVFVPDEPQSCKDGVAAQAFLASEFVAPIFANN
ncbi:hypothetical protein CCMSSC00406_0008827 [Pleurotus cornucopiae]|uniref:Uncharacterized protein n=1 Tax=Pleurotus cornucopiae TaxID=5321 RepID=A0ACB7IJD2_PLECO|nr:hypothetical protein CCMSSC00406_0008827 [Pleurotus cornucopiae]